MHVGCGGMTVLDLYFNFIHIHKISIRSNTVFYDQDPYHTRAYCDILLMIVNYK